MGRTPHLGWSSAVYPLEAGDLARLPDYDGAPLPDAALPADGFLLHIRPDGPDSLLRGRAAVAAAAPDAVLPVRVVFTPSVPKWHLPATLIRVLRNRYRYEGTGVYHISARTVRAMGLERAHRTTDNPQRRKNKDRTASMRRLLESLRTRGFDDLRPINVQLCRTGGRRDSLRQGHHRVSACLECGIDRMAVHFSAAGALPRGRAPKLLAAGAAALLAAAAVGAAAAFRPAPPAPPVPSDAALRAEIIGDISRPRDPCDLSGLSPRGNDLYWSVGDSGGYLYGLRIPVDPATGRLAGCDIVERHVLPGGRDLEGCATDPLDGTVVWVSDENGPALRAFRIEAGASSAAVAVDLPPLFAHARRNRSLEALAIRPDGLEMWTCNEDPLPADETDGRGEGYVRLTRFTRTGAGAAWTPAGQFAYRPEAPCGGARHGKGHNGVAELCVLADGEVLVLEREKKDAPAPRFRTRICRAVRTDATDVSGLAALAGARFTPVAKRLVFEADTGLAMYEGLCEGPTLANGDGTLLLVSDGDGEAEERVLSLRLVRTAADTPGDAR